MMIKFNWTLFLRGKSSSLSEIIVQIVFLLNIFLFHHSHFFCTVDRWCIVSIYTFLLGKLSTISVEEMHFSYRLSASEQYKTLIKEPWLFDCCLTTVCPHNTSVFLINSDILTSLSRSLSGLVEYSFLSLRAIWNIKWW